MVIEIAANPEDQREALIALYDAALDDVYGYLLHRCGSPPVAEDLTSETFLAAADAVRRGSVHELTVAWLIGVARNKLVDHWRRREREQRSLTAVAGEPEPIVDALDGHIDTLTAHAVLAELGSHHRTALTLRYVDGLPVRQVAELLDRSEGATEALLVRAKAAFRTAYARRHADPEEDR